MSIEVMTRVWKHSRHKEGTLLVLLAIADFANDDGVAFPSMATIAKKARMSPRNAQLAVRRLEHAGELAVTIGGAPPPYTGCNLFRVSLATGVQQTLSGGEASDTKGVKSTSPKPSTEPSTEPSKVRAASRLPSVKDELKAMTQTAGQLWVTERNLHRQKSGEAFSRFTDRRAVANLRQACERAVLVGEWQDIELAIRVNASNPTSNPWYLDEWTRAQAGLRHAAETLQRKMSERDRETDELRVRSPLRQIGGTTAQVLADARSRLDA